MIEFLEAAKLIWDVIKGTRNLKKVDSTIPLTGNARKDFLNNNPNATIVYVQGDCYIGDRSQLNNEDKNKIKEIYDPNSDNEKKFDIINTDFFDRVQEFKKELPDNKSINPFIKYLDYDLKTILNLSIYAKKLFDGGEWDKAQRVREDIGKHYGKEGRRLCNLYLSGYIDGMTEFLINSYSQDNEKLKKELNPTIRRFLQKSDYIFFIHEKTDIEEVINDIRKFIMNGKIYIAIHGAGLANIKIIRDILKELEQELVDLGYDINEENQRTLSLCPLLYVYLTKRVKK